MLRILARALAAFLFCLTVGAPAFGAARTYTVVRGDSLSSISERAGVSASEIVRLNHLSDPNFVREGQVLQLSAAPAQHNAVHAAKHRIVLAKAPGARHLAERKAWTGNPAQMAEHQALWVAMHTGFSAPDFAASPSFAAAQRMIALELRLTKTALRYLGVPYEFGGESYSGVDCSGFVQAVFRRNGIELPRTADAQFDVGRRVSQAGLLPGDLVFFQTYAEGASHVGIYLGAGQFVHASTSHGVRVDSLSEDYYASRYIGARRAPI